MPNNETQATPITNPIVIPQPNAVLDAALSILRTISNDVQQGIDALEKLVTAPGPFPPVPLRRQAALRRVNIHTGATMRQMDGTGPVDPGPRPRPAPMPAPTPQPQPTVGSADVTVGANAFGIVFTLSHNAAQSLAVGAEQVAEVLDILSDAAAEFPPAELVLDLVSSYIDLEGDLIRAVDKGNGVYLTMPYLLPGVVVPGTR